MARTTQNKALTAEQILNLISSPSAANAPSNLSITDLLANNVASVTDHVGRISGAIAASGTNFVEQFKLESLVQKARSQARLQAAARAAAERINSAFEH